MARVEIDPNYSSPTFPRATAAADIFKKEDVQALAAAMSTHTHDGAGKGLALTTLPAAAIASGTITSAMIADGTIDTADLKDGAVTSAKIFDGTIATVDLAANAITQTVSNFGLGTFPNSGFATTSATFVKNPDYHLAITTVGGPVFVFAVATINIPFGAIGAVAIAMDLDTVGTHMAISRVSPSIPSGSLTLNHSSMGIWAPAAGAHVFDLMVTINSGAFSWDTGAGIQFFAVELKR